MKSNTKFFRKSKTLPVDEFFNNVLYDNTANAYWWGGSTKLAQVQALGNIADNIGNEQVAEYLVKKWFLDPPESMVKKWSFDGSGPPQKMCPKSCQKMVKKLSKNGLGLPGDNFSKIFQ